MKSRSKFTASNVLLWILTLTSFYIILSVGLEVIPQKEVSWSKNFIENFNTVLLNLSYSYLAAVIFYLLVNYLPELKRKKRFQPVVKRDIKKIHSLFLNMINSMGSEDPKYSSIPDKETFQALMENVSPNELYPPTKGQVTEATYLKSFFYMKEETKDIMSHIHQFKKHTPDKIISLLEELNSSKLFKEIVMWNSLKGGIINDDMGLFADQFYGAFNIVSRLKKEADHLYS